MIKLNFDSQVEKSMKDYLIDGIKIPSKNKINYINKNIIIQEEQKVYYIYQA